MAFFNNFRPVIEPSSFGLLHRFAASLHIMLSRNDDKLFKAFQVEIDMQSMLKIKNMLVSIILTLSL